MAEERLLKFKPRGPTVNGIKPLLRLDDDGKKKILQKTRADWKELLRLHFEAEAGITSSGTRAWAPLSAKHLRYKELNDFSENILEMSSPPLVNRYQKAIRYNTKNFQIFIDYPILLAGARGGGAITARIHQKPYTTGAVRRRILLSSFTKALRNRILEGIGEEQ